MHQIVTTIYYYPESEYDRARLVEVIRRSQKSIRLISVQLYGILRNSNFLCFEDFPEARKPAYKLQIDFGDEIGIKKSSAQITVHYTKETLLNKQVAAVVNFPPRQIGPIMSEVLTLGFPDENGEVVLFSPDLEVPKGARLF